MGPMTFFGRIELLITGHWLVRMAVQSNEASEPVGNHTTPNKRDCASSHAVVTPWASAAASRISDSGV